MQPRTSMLALLAAAVLAVFAVATGTATTRATSTPAPVADLAGVLIPIGEVAAHYCHDLDYPRIHCFAQPEELESAVSATQTSRTLQVAAGAQYMKLFDLAGYTGTYIILSLDYNDLSTIGWNDRASSYIGVNNLAFGLWTAWYMTGSGIVGCCNQRASSLSSTFDNQISSTQLR